MSELREQVKAALNLDFMTVEITSGQVRAIANFNISMPVEKAREDPELCGRKLREGIMTFLKPSMEYTL